MKNVILGFVMILSLTTAAQMNNQRLGELLEAQVDSINGGSGRWQLFLQELPMLVLTDETNDRMRIVAPITEAARLDEELLLDCLTANFHSALDVKYAISDGILWSVYIHPLSPLTEMEIESAVKQVHSAAITFGTTFSSTPLLFGGNRAAEPVPAKKDSIIFKKT